MNSYPTFSAFDGTVWDSVAPTPFIARKDALLSLGVSFPISRFNSLRIARGTCCFLCADEHLNGPHATHPILLKAVGGDSRAAGASHAILRGLATLQGIRTKIRQGIEIVYAVGLQLMTFPFKSRLNFGANAIARACTVRASMSAFIVLTITPRKVTGHGGV
jgi:hypothetical protein